MGIGITIGKIRMKNPIMVASGTFGCGKEYEDIVDLKNLGAIVAKTITLYPRSGNEPPRLIETASGLLNSIGIENDGVDSFLKEKAPYLARLDIPAIASIGGASIGEFVKLAARLDGAEGISGIEVNISCPNLGSHRLFAQDARETARLIKKVRKATGLTLITKLTPNVTDITEIAKAAEGAGSDALALVNTYMGMAVDIYTKRPRLGNIVGGLSGPAIKPLALKAVWDTYNAVKIPIIGMGGVSDARDAIEFMLCGASAVALGSINFVNPSGFVGVVSGIKDYLKRESLHNVSEITGSLKTGE